MMIEYLLPFDSMNGQKYMANRISLPTDKIPAKSSVVALIAEEIYCSECYIRLQSSVLECVSKLRAVLSK